MANKTYVLIGLGLWLIVFLSFKTEVIYNLFVSIFGVFFIVAQYGMVILGFWIFIIGLLSSPSQHHFHHHRHH